MDLYPVLEKVAAPTMAEVVTDGVPREQTPHDGGQWGGASPQQEVKVVGDQCPGTAACLNPN